MQSVERGRGLLVVGRGHPDLFPAPSFDPLVVSSPEAWSSLAHSFFYSRMDGNRRTLGTVVAVYDTPPASSNGRPAASPLGGQRLQQGTDVVARGSTPTFLQFRLVKGSSASGGPDQSSPEASLGRVQNAFVAKAIRV